MTIIPISFLIQFRHPHTTQNGDVPISEKYNYKLKSQTPSPLVSNVVYPYTWPCNTGETYVGMSFRRLATRAKEHLNLNNNRKSAIKDHLQQCESCSKSKVILHSSFTVIS